MPDAIGSARLKPVARQSPMIVALAVLAAIPLRAQDLPVLRVRPEQQIGALHDFTRITRATIGPDGLIAIAQPEDGNVALFALRSPARPVTVVGRSGEGPGEFARVADLGWIDDHLWVVDGARPRIEVFTSSGRHLASHVPRSPASPNHRVRYMGPTFALRDSVRLFVPTIVVSPMDASPSGHEARAPVLLQHGARLDTIARLPLLRNMMVLHGDGDAAVVASRPLVAPDFVLAGANGTRVVLVLQAEGIDGDGRVRVRMLASDDRLLYDRVLEVASPPLTDRTWDSVFTRQVRSYVGDLWKSEARARDELARALIRPARRPAFAAAVLGRDGRVWLQREADRAEWVVLDAQGREAGRLRLDADTRILAADAAGLLAVRRDAEEVEHVLWLALIGP